MRRALLGIAVLLLLGLGLLLASFRAAALPLTPQPAFKDPAARGPEGMTLTAIRAGTMFSEAVFSYRGGASGQERQFAMGGILVHHPRGDLLFDTGFGKNVDEHVRTSPFLMRKLARYSKGTPIKDQLAAAHVDTSRLTGIVITHAHWDHVSGIEDFPGVPIYLPQRELDFIRSGDTAAELIRRFGDLPYKVYGFPSGPYLGFEESYDFFGDGSVVLVAAGGHTPGSIMAFVNLPNGKRYALVGDIVWQREGVDIPAERPWLARKMVDKDEERVRTVVVRLHMLEQRFPELVVVPAHDSRVWDTLPKLGGA
jgi:glyoxylase-like metal-dependent hydrolase (beta-lactamase superfamily II)